jgi:hypothetical protein
MRTVIGVMGSGTDGDAGLLAQARELGRAIAEQDWVLLNGGRDAGIMHASAQGASEAGGLVIGVLPGTDARESSPWLDIQILTGLGDARNVVNALSSDVVIALRGGAGTLSEIALALCAGRTVITLGRDDAATFAGMGAVIPTSTIDEAIAAVRAALARKG